MAVACSIFWPPSPPTPKEQIRKTKRTFEKYGLRCLLVAKFVPGINTVAPPLAGMSGSSISRFLVYDSAGSAIWAATYAGVGLLFCRQLNRIAVEVSRFAGILAAALGIPLAVYMILTALKFIPVSRSLRLHHIQPSRLMQKINNGDKILILDLLGYREGTEAAPGIPTSVRLDLSRVREARRVLFPSDKGMSVEKLSGIQSNGTGVGIRGMSERVRS